MKCLWRPGHRKQNISMHCPCMHLTTVDLDHNVSQIEPLLPPSKKNKIKQNKMKMKQLRTKVVSTRVLCLLPSRVSIAPRLYEMTHHTNKPAAVGDPRHIVMSYPTSA